MKKQHIGNHNDYPCHSRVKKHAKSISSKRTRRVLERETKKEENSHES